MAARGGIAASSGAKTRLSALNFHKPVSHARARALGRLVPRALPPYLRHSKLQTNYGEFAQNRRGRAPAMRVQDEIDEPGACPRAFAFSPRSFAVALLCLTAGALAGCGLGDGAGAGAMLVDPGHYSAYHCDELAARWKVLIAREAELRGLMGKASEGTGGSLIGSLAYRTDYDS